MLDEPVSALLLGRKAARVVGRRLGHVGVVSLASAGGEDSGVGAVEMDVSRLSRAEHERNDGAKPADPSDGDVSHDRLLVLVRSVGTLKSEESVDRGLRDSGLGDDSTASGHDDLRYSERALAQTIEVRADRDKSLLGDPFLHRRHFP